MQGISSGEIRIILAEEGVEIRFVVNGMEIDFSEMTMDMRLYLAEAMKVVTIMVSTANANKIKEMTLN